MVRTITIGSCMSVQGKVVEELKDGRVVVAVGDRTYLGFPVETALAA